MKKLTNKKGFTLMEMIIVVAIIAILAVVTIPTLTANTGKAEKAADAANLRAAKGAYQVLALNDQAPTEGQVYDVATGGFKAASSLTDADKCGQCSEHKTSTGAAHIVVASGTVQWSFGDSVCGN